MALDPQLQALMDASDGQVQALVAAARARTPRAAGDSLDAQFAALGLPPDAPATTAGTPQAAGASLDAQFAALGLPPEELQTISDPQLRALAAQVNAMKPPASGAGDTQTGGSAQTGSGAIGSGARSIMSAVAAPPLAAMNLGVAARNGLESLAQRIPAFGGKSLADRIYGINRTIEGAVPQSLQQITGSILPTGPAGGYTLPSQEFAQNLDAVIPPPASRLGRFAEGVDTLLAGATLPLPMLGKTPTVSNPAPAALAAATPSRTLSAAQIDAEAARRTSMGYGAGADVLPNSSLTPAQVAAARGGSSLGMRLTPGQASGSTALQQLEARAESQPWTSGPFAALKGGNQAALNRAAAQAIGESSPIVDSTVLGRANDRLGDVFESVRGANRVLMQAPEVTQNAIKGIDSEFNGLLPGNMSIADHPLVAQLKDLTDTGSINGEQLGQLSSKLGRAAYKQMSSASGDRDLGQALYQVKDHVEDLVQSTLSGDEAATYAAARGQYRTLMTLLSRSNIVNPSTGDVSGTALASRLQQIDRQGYTFGANQTPLYQAARFAQAFKPIVGNSGTATRSAGHGVGLPIALAIGAHMAGAPIGADLAAAAAPALGRGAANLAARAYLTRPGAALARGVGNLAALPGATARGIASLPRRAPFMVTPLPGTPAGALLPPWMAPQPAQ